MEEGYSASGSCQGVGRANVQEKRQALPIQAAGCARIMP
jgi:hypothetical protein